jgi:toxin-antitoxin system PIN domain toxin
LLDANLLIYAYDSSSPRHDRARSWLEATMGGAEPVRISWSTIRAFLRVTTNPRLLDTPLSMAEAVGVVDDWLSQPSVAVLEPGSQHWRILKHLLAEAQVRGPMVTDTHLAALAIEHGAILQTTDRDFTRFPGLRFKNPLSE